MKYKIGDKIILNYKVIIIILTLLFILIILTHFIVRLDNLCGEYGTCCNLTRI